MQSCAAARYENNVIAHVHMYSHFPVCVFFWQRKEEERRLGSEGRTKILGWGEHSLRLSPLVLYKSQVSVPQNR